MGHESFPSQEDDDTNIFGHTQEQVYIGPDPTDEFDVFQPPLGRPDVDAVDFNHQKTKGGDTPPDTL